MMGEVAVALMLFCAGKPLPGAGTSADNVAVIKVPVNETMLAALKADPPVAKMTFEGETTGQREWIFGGSPGPAEIKVLRLTKSNDPLSPFSFRTGTVTEQSGRYAFNAIAAGKCDLRPQNSAPKGSK